jgi:hypothetical protein
LQLQTSGFDDLHIKQPPWAVSLKEEPSSLRGRRTLGTFIFDASDDVT